MKDFGTDLDFLKHCTYSYLLNIVLYKIPPTPVLYTVQY
jgi:hypothetical protein